jgi:hypothetical protein
MFLMVWKGIKKERKLVNKSPFCFFGRGFCKDLICHRGAEKILGERAGDPQERRGSPALFFLSNHNMYS